MATHSNLGTKRYQVPHILNGTTNKRAERDPLSRLMRGGELSLRRKERLGGRLNSQPLGIFDGDRGLLPLSEERVAPQKGSQGPHTERITCRGRKCLRGETGICPPAGKLVRPQHLQAHVTGATPAAPRLESQGHRDWACFWPGGFRRLAAGWGSACPQDE